MEEWKDIKGYEGYYQVSNLGRVRSLDRLVKGKNNGLVPVRGRIRKLPLSNAGYPVVCLGKEGVEKTKSVHVLVAEAFIGPRPVDLQVCHNNGIPTDNQVSNLRYGTAQENADDRDLHGNQRRGSKSCRAKLNEKQVKDAIKWNYFGISQVEIAKAFGVHTSTINLICSGKNWNHLTRIKSDD